MRVVVIAGSYPPDGGGAERQMQRVLGELRARGHESIAIARRWPGVERRYELDGVEVHRLGNVAINPLNAVLFTLQAALAAARAKPDVLVALQAGSAPMAAAIAKVLSRGRTPFIMRLTGPGVGGNQLVDRARTPVGRRLTAFMLNRADRLVAPAAHLFAGSGVFQSRVDAIGRVVPNGAPRLAHPQDARSDVSSVIWVGRDDAAKNYPAFLELVRQCPDIQFTSVGIDQSLSQGLENLVAVGRVADALPYIAAAKVLVSTSSREGSPNVVLEALAAGVKVVAFDLPGTREIAEQTAHGMSIVTQLDTDGLAAALRAALADPTPVDGHVPTVEEATDEWLHTLTEVAASKR